MHLPGVAEAGEAGEVAEAEGVEAADLVAKVRRAAEVFPHARVQEVLNEQPVVNPAGALPRGAGVPINRIGRVP